MAKLSKAAVNYRPATTRDRRCGTCSMYQQGGTCSLVAGSIDTDDVCDRWQPKPRRINWWRLELRSRPPSDDDIKAAVAAAKALPECDDGKDQVALPWPCYQGDDIPKKIDWSQSKLKMVRFDDLLASPGQPSIDRDQLIWHIQHPGQSLHDDVAPYVVKMGGDRVIMDGQHRLMALQMLGFNKAQMFQVKEKNL